MEDGVHSFTMGQKAIGITNAETEFRHLLDGGLKVELCGTCLNFRGIGDDLIIKGAEPSSMRNLCRLIDDCDSFVSHSTHYCFKVNSYICIYSIFRLSCGVGMNG